MVVGAKIRLYPTPEQEQQFIVFCNTVRFVYNAVLAYKIDCYNEEGYNYTKNDLYKHLMYLRELKEFSWLKNTPLYAETRALYDVERAFTAYFRRNKKAGYPHFKKKGKSKMSFAQSGERIFHIDSNHIRLSRIDTPVRVKKQLLSYNLMNVRVSYDGKFWWLGYAYEVSEENLSESKEVIGVDLGIKNFAITSDGVIYPNINKTKRVRQLEKRKRHLHHLLEHKYKINGFYQKTSNIEKLEAKYLITSRKLKNIRETYLHQITYDLVKSKPGIIVIEDLAVSKMLTTSYLRKSILQQEFFKFRQYLTYKCKFYGVQLVVADRYFASSKTCSCCKTERKSLSLSERTFICPKCGYTQDRDINAAINLRNYAYALNV